MNFYKLVLYTHMSLYHVALATNAEGSRELTQSLMTEHLQQIRSFFDTQRQYYVSASAGIVPDFHYISLEDTQQASSNKLYTVYTNKCTCTVQYTELLVSLSYNCVCVFEFSTLQDIGLPSPARLRREPNQSGQASKLLLVSLSRLIEQTL